MSRPARRSAPSACARADAATCDAPRGSGSSSASFAAGVVDRVLAAAATSFGGVGAGDHDCGPVPRRDRGPAGVARPTHRHPPTARRSRRPSPIPSGRRPDPTAPATAASSTTPRPATRCGPAPTARSSSPGRWPARSTSPCCTPTGCARPTRSSTPSTSCSVSGSRPATCRHAGERLHLGARSGRRLLRPCLAVRRRRGRGRAAAVRDPAGQHATGRGPGARAAGVRTAAVASASPGSSRGWDGCTTAPAPRPLRHPLHLPARGLGARRRPGRPPVPPRTVLRRPAAGRSRAGSVGWRSLSPGSAREQRRLDRRGPHRRARLRAGPTWCGSATPAAGARLHRRRSAISPPRLRDRGHPGRPPRRGRRLADLVEDVAAADPGVPIDLIAHSQGGVVAGWR